MDNEEKRLMSLTNTQTPTRGQHSNVMEFRIKMIKQYCHNIIGQVKGEKFKPINLTQSEFIMASAINEVNNMPLFRHERYVFLTSAMLVNPLFELTVGQLENDIIVKYFDVLQPYLELIADLCF